MKSADIYISIENVSKLYSRDKGIRNVTTRFECGQLNLLVGANGSGKTTLLKCIMGLVRYQGKIDRERTRIGYAPEQYVMPSFMNVTDFLISIGRVKKHPQAELRKAVEEKLKLFGLDGMSAWPIGKLSNGMKQKINLLQSIIHKPGILLLDEPLAALDLEARKTFVSLIRQLCKSTLIIVSTHYPDLFRERKARIYRIEKGRIVTDGPA